MYDNTVKTLLHLGKSLEYSRVIFPIDLHLIFEISSFKNEFDEFVFLSILNLILTLCVACKNQQ